MSSKYIWKTLGIPLAELDLKILEGGQSFRWKPLAPQTWRSVLGGHVITLRQTGTKHLGSESFQLGSCCLRFPMDSPPLWQWLAGAEGIMETKNEDLVQDWSAAMCGETSFTAVMVT